MKLRIDLEMDEIHIVLTPGDGEDTDAIFDAVSSQYLDTGQIVIGHKKISSVTTTQGTKP